MTPTPKSRPTGPLFDGGPVVRIDSDDPKLTGEIEFRIPTFYDQVAIERRMTELVNANAGPGQRLLRVENLPNYGRYVVEAIAHLEHVIVRAPEGFYEPTDGGPELAVGRLSTADQDVLTAAYEGFLAYRTRFREDRGRDDRNDAARPKSETAGDRSGQDEREPEGSAGDPE